MQIWTRRVTPSANPRYRYELSKCGGVSASAPDLRRVMHAAARPGHGDRVDASGGNTMAVMPALVAGIHDLTAPVAKKTWVDGRDKPGHDGGEGRVSSSP